MAVFRSRLPASLLVIVVSVAGFAPFASQVAAQRAQPRLGNGVVRGVVVASESGTPVHRAYVRMKPVQGDEVGAITDQRGRFEFTRLASGDYGLSVSKGGRVTRQFGQGPEDAEGTGIEVIDGRAIDDVVVSLPRGAVIAGRLIDETGQPMVGVRIAALVKRFASGAMELADNWAWPENYADLTDDRGHYRVIGLPAGTYYIGGFSEARLGSSVGNNPLRDRDFPATYFPGTYNARAATAITVREGEERAADFALSTSRLVHVTGQVLKMTGEPEPEAMVILSDRYSLTPSGEVDVLRLSGSREGGRFELTNVPPGEYELTAHTRDDSPGGPRQAKLKVMVDTIDVSALRLVLAPGGRVTGRVVMEGGAPFPKVPEDLRVYFVRATPIPYMVLGSPRASLDTDGSFTAESGYDTQYVRAGTMKSSWCLKRVRRDGQDVTDTPIAFAPFLEVAGLEIEMTPRCSSISGVVRDTRGRVVERMQVLAYARDPRLWLNTSRFVRHATTNTQGNYQFNDLPPNTDYLVIAAPLVGATYNQDPAYRKKLGPLATAVMLRENETRVQDLNVVRLPR